MIIRDRRRARKACAIGLAMAATAGCGSVHSSEWRGPDAARNAVRAAAVLPLENLTTLPDAGRVVADVLSTELSARRIDVVDRGKSESSLASVDLLPGATVDRLAAQRLGELLGVDAVLFGSVAEAAPASPGTGPRKAAVGLTVRLVDVKTGAYLLAGSYTASAGDDSITAAARLAAAEIGKAVGR